MVLVGLKINFIFKCKRHYRSFIFRQMLNKMIKGELSLPLSDFYVSCTCYVYPMQYLPNCYISAKHAKYQLRLSSN